MRLTARQKKQLASLAQAFGIKLALVYGSVAKGQAGPKSDLDLGLWLADSAGLTGGRYFDLMAKLQAVFPQKEVDAVILNHADPLFLKQIASHFKLIYGRPSQAQDFYLYAISRYQDFAPYLKKEAAYVNAALNLT